MVFSHIGREYVPIIHIFHYIAQKILEFLFSLFPCYYIFFQRTLRTYRMWGSGLAIGVYLWALNKNNLTFLSQVYKLLGSRDTKKCMTMKWHESYREPIKDAMRSDTKRTSAPRWWDLKDKQELSMLGESQTECKREGEGRLGLWAETDVKELSALCCRKEVGAHFKGNRGVLGL